MRQMKDRKVGFYEQVPAGWSLRKIKNVAQFINGDRGSNYPSGDDLVDEGVYFLTSFNLGEHYINLANGLTKCITRERYDLLGGAKLRKNDIVFCLRGSIGKCSINNQLDEGTIASSLVVIRSIKADSDYLYYYLNSKLVELQTENYMNGTCAANLSAESVGKFVFLEPPLKRQRELVDYLNSKCSQIDSVIEKQEAIIEKLKEYKLSVITEAVTKGLDPNVEMKDSGSVWFGSIPVNWDMKKLKFVFRIKKEIAGKEGYTVLSITQRGIVPKDFSNNEGQFANSYANYQLVSCGDFAMNHMDLLTGWVDISKYDGVTSPDYRVFVLDDTTNNDPNYYLYLMQMCYSERIFYGLGAGVSGLGRWRLQADKFLNFLIPVPSKSEQTQIAQYISNRTESVERSILERQRIIEKLVEFKKSLIYEVVTGKKEI